mgnify:CR=1 FL=1
MSFDPQIPDWGKEFTDNRQEKLFTIFPNAALFQKKGDPLEPT